MNWNPDYDRVHPRDFFNEAKLLKCWGRLSLLIHEGRGIDWPLRIEHDDSECKGYAVRLDGQHAMLFIDNVRLFVCDVHVPIGNVCNSKNEWPMYGGEDFHCVFDDDGELSPEFRKYLDFTHAESFKS